jgi:uncharacterized SAM-dependent methyltransferase
VQINSSEFVIAEGETIHTENSYKYSEEAFEHLLQGTGFRIARTWTDAARLFSVHELEVI